MFAGSEALSTAPKAQGRAPQQAADEGLFGAPDEDGGDVPLFSRKRPTPEKVAEAADVSGLKAAFDEVRGEIYATGRELCRAVTKPATGAPALC